MENYNYRAGQTFRVIGNSEINHSYEIGSIITLKGVSLIGGAFINEHGEEQILSFDDVELIMVFMKEELILKKFPPLLNPSIELHSEFDEYGEYIGDEDDEGDEDDDFEDEEDDENSPPEYERGQKFRVALNGSHLFNKGDIIELLYIDEDDKNLGKFSNGKDSQWLFLNEVMLYKESLPYEKENEMLLDFKLSHEIDILFDKIMELHKNNLIDKLLAAEDYTSLTTYKNEGLI